MSLSKRLLVLPLACACLSLPCVRLFAEPPDGGAPSSILPGRPDAQTPTAQESERLGNDFESNAAGIAFRAPAGMKEIRSAGGDVIVRYVDEKRHWVLVVSKLQFERPLKLLPSPAAAPGQAAPKGLLELTAEQIRTDAPGAEFFRQDTITVGGVDVGMLASRVAIGKETDLAQQAFFHASDKIYYQFNLSVPAPRTGALDDDADIQSAVATFTDVLDSVRLLEQTAIHDEQVQRLYRTRTLFVNLTEEKLRKALIPEQWVRLLKDGRDVGYSYVVEEVGRDLPRPGHKESQFTGGVDGALIGVRSRTVPEAGVRVDAQSWMWVSFDRKHEKWSNVAFIDRGNDAAGRPQREQVGDVGSSDVQEESVYDKNLAPGEKIGPGKNDVDKNQPSFKRAEIYTLNVQHIGKNQSNEPVVRDLPVFYIPQALAQLLPTLVPRKQPTSFMFASYVADRREVMSRYVDVGAEERVTLGDHVVQAVPVRDRIGLEGSITTNYISPAGEYLGTVNTDSKIMLLPTDSVTLQRIWKDVDLSRPGAVPEGTLAAPR